MEDQNGEIKWPPTDGVLAEAPSEVEWPPTDGIVAEEEITQENKYVFEMPDGSTQAILKQQIPQFMKDNPGAKYIENEPAGPISGSSVDEIIEENPDRTLTDEEQLDFAFGPDSTKTFENGKQVKSIFDNKALKSDETSLTQEQIDEGLLPNTGEPTYKEKVDIYNKEITNISNDEELTGDQKLRSIQELAAPNIAEELETGEQFTANIVGDIIAQDDEYMDNQGLIDEVNSIYGSVGNENIRAGIAEPADITTEAQLKEKTGEIFTKLQRQDPLIKTKLEAYKKLFLPQTQQYMKELEKSGKYNMTTQKGVDDLQDDVNTYYTDLLENAMENDESVIAQSEKIGKFVQKAESEKAIPLGRSEYGSYRFYDIAKGQLERIPFIGGALSDVMAGTESLQVSTEDMYVKIFDQVAAQVDGMQVGGNKEGLAKLDQLIAEGKSEDDQVFITVDMDIGGEIRIPNMGTKSIKELREDFGGNIESGTESLIENVKNIEEFKNFQDLTEQAKFTDGISFKDIMIGLGASIPTMAAASAGTIASVVAPEVMIPLIGALGSAAVTTSYYADNFMASVEQGIKDNPEKYSGTYEENLKKALIDGEFNNVAEDVAAAVVMGQLEKIGSGATLNSLFKVLKVTNKAGNYSGIKSLFADGMKEYLKKVAKGTVVVGKNSLTEGLTEVAQGAIEQFNKGYKEGGISNIGKYVDTEELLEQGLAGSTIGAVIPFSAQIKNQIQGEYRNLALKFAERFPMNLNKNLVRRQEFFKQISAEVKKKYSDANGNVIDKAKYQEEMAAISDIRNAGLKVPSSFSEEGRTESLKLMIERQKLKRQIADNDVEAFTNEDKKRIKDIDNRLNEIYSIEKVFDKTGDVNFKAKKISEALNTEFVELEDDAAVEDYITKRGLKGGKEASGSRGNFFTDPNTKEDIILINKKRVKDSKGYFTAGHEVLHKVLAKTIAQGDANAFAMAQAIKDKLKTIDTSKAANVKGREDFFRRLNQYVTDPNVDTAEAAEEAMTLMSEAMEYGDIKFDRSFLQVMSDFIKKMAAVVMPDTYGKYKFENENDVYKFLRDYNKSFNKGKLSKAIMKAADEGIDISEDLIKRGEKAEAKRQKKIQVQKKKRESETTFKGAKDDVINRLNEQGASPAEIANEFYGDVDRFIRSGKFKIGGTPLIDNPKIKAYDEEGYRKEGAVEIEDIVFGILYAPRGVVGLIEDYRKKPQEYRDKVTLGQFVNDTKVGFRTRAIAIAAEILGMKTQGEYKGDDYADSTTETKKSLRQTMLELETELDLEEGSELYNDVIESTIKILGTSLPKISSDKFLAALRKSSNSFLETKMKKLMGTPRSTQYKDFIEKFGLAILNKVDQRTLNKRFQPLTEPDIDPETGKQRRILTKESRQEGSRVKNPYAGNPARKIKPNLTPQDLVDFFINSKRPDARRNTLAQVVANEFTEDSIPMVLQEVVEVDSITGEEVTVGDLREEKFGEDVVKAEVAYIARDLGRGVDYKFAKDGIPRTIPASKEQIFSSQANKLIDIAFEDGYKDDNGNLTDKYRTELAKVDPLVAEYMEAIFEENIDLINADSGFQKILKNSDRVSQSMKDNIKDRKLLLFKKKELQKDVADAFNDNSKYMGGILDSRIFKNLGGIDLLGYKNRYLDPAFRKIDKINSTPGNTVYLKNPDGSFVTGEYYTDYLEVLNLEVLEELGFNPNDIIAINKDSKKLKPILKDILSTENLDQKLEKLEKYKAKLEKANKANIGAFKHISLKLQQALKDGKITEEYVYQLLQAQTNIVMGLRALSSIDYLYLKEGNQQLPTKKTFNIKDVGTDKFNQYYNELMNVVDFKERYDLATKLYKQEGLSGAKLELAALNKAYTDLTIKGEHLGPNANTMASLYEHIVNGTLTNEVLNDLLKEHSQFFAPNFITDLIDKKGIETGSKSGMTSKEGLFRLTKFLPPRFAKHAYSITGETAAKKIVREEVILKDIANLKASKDNAKREDIKMLEDSKVLDLDENMSMEQVLEKAITIDKALEVARKLNAPVKKIRVFDFDDTVARTKSKVIATRIEPSKHWETRKVTTEMYGSDRSGRAYKKGRDSEGKINKSRAEDIIYTARQRDQIALKLENNTPLVREALETLGMTSKSDIRKARHGKDDKLEGKLRRSLRKEPKFEEKMLTAEEFAEQGERLTNEGWKMDFSEFNKVVDGKAGPLLNVAKKIQEARGTEDVFILTARAQQAAPAIKKFLDAMGLNIPLKNITGLANSSPQAKANWILDKAAEGYNDFYFADDAMANVNAVKKVLDVVDVKGKVQQAKIKAAKDFDREFNRIIEQKTGVAAHKVYSEAKGKVRGSSKGKFKFWIPYSAEDFVGLIYPLLSKNELGDKQMAWFKRNLLDPYNRAMQNLSSARLQLMNDFKALKKDLKIPKTLEKEAIEGFSNEQAVRVYLWNKQGVNIPGLSKSDIKALTNVVENDLLLKEFADQLEQINKDPYPSPQDSWLAGTITTDLIDGLNTTKREKYLKEWQDNVDTIFSDKNLNKLEAVYGSKYVEALKNILSRMKSGKNRLESGNRLSNRVLNYINGSNAAIMFLNTRSAILQTISSINFINWNFNNPYQAGKAFANQPQYWKDFMELMNSEYLKDRRNGLRINITESEISDLAKTTKNKAKAVIAYILKKGYLPTQFADSFAIATGGATFYRNRINDLIKNQGLSEKEASKIAMEEFIDISEVSQQSSNPSKISSQQSSDMGRLILMFANTPMQYARIQKRALQDLISGRGDAKANVSKIVYYGFIQNIIFNGLQQALWMMGFGDDEEEDEKKVSKTVNGMLDSQLRGLGFGGSAVSVAKNFLLDIYERSKRTRPEYSDAAWKLLQISPPISSKISRLRAAAWPFESKKRRKEMEDKGFSIDNPAYESLTKVISATTNIPLDRLLAKYNNISAALEEDAAWWQSVAMLAGWPSWTIKPDAEEVAKKKERKEKKKISDAKKKEKEAQEEIDAIEKSKREKGKGKSRHTYKNGRIPAAIRTDREDELYDLSKKQQEDSLKILVPDYYTNKRLRDLNEGDRVAAIINING